MRRIVSALALALAAGTARADRLHLQGGGVVDADRWWIEGETLHVESAGGTMGFPRSLLVSVDRVAPSPRATPVPAPARAARLPASPNAESVRLMREGNAALAARDFEGASRAFYEVMRAVPDEVGPRVGFAIAEMSVGRDHGALAAVLEGLVRHPQDAQLQELLGDLKNRDERVDDAVAAWREAFRVAPSDRLRGKIEKAERELQAGRGYAFSAAPHFNLRFDGEADQDLVGAIEEVLEADYLDLTARFRHAPGPPITVLVYPRQAFRDVTQAGDEVAGLFDGKIRVPLGGLRRLDAAAEKVLTHELTHAIVHSKTRGSCPRWLQEGLAQIAEDRPLTHADRARVARSVSAGDPGTWPDARFSYAAALSFTRFLEAERGFDALVSVLDRLGDGERLDDALRGLYARDYAELAATWATTLRSEVP